MTTNDQALSIEANRKPTKKSFPPRVEYYPDDFRKKVQAVINEENRHLFTPVAFVIAAAINTLRFPFTAYLTVNYDRQNPCLVKIDRVGTGKRLLPVGRTINLFDQVMNDSLTVWELADLIEQQIIGTVRTMRKELNREKKSLKKSVRLLTTIANACN